MVITLEGGGGRGVNRVIVFFKKNKKINNVNARDNYMQVYKQNNIKTIVYKVKE